MTVIELRALSAPVEPFKGVETLSRPRPFVPPGRPGPDTTFLDGLRGLAALYVCVRHASVYLYGPAAPASTFQRVVTAGLGSFRFAVAAVYFFFVLSGFVIHLRYARKLAADPLKAEFGWGGFVWRRVRRLYPPLLFAVVLTFAFDAAGTTLHLPVYHNEAGLRHLVNAPDHAPATLLANLAFLANVHVPTSFRLGEITLFAKAHLPALRVVRADAHPVWGTDGPLWSLTFEWWFYMIYPLFWWLSKRSMKLAGAVVAVGFGLHYAMRPFPALHLLQMTLTAFPCWWFGAVLADVYAGRIKVPFLALSPLVLLLPFTITHPDNPIRVIGLAFGFSGLIALCFGLERRGLLLRPLRALKPLGDMSYTLYLIHMPICVFLSGWYMSQSVDRHLPATPTLLVLTLLALLPLAWLAHLLVERPFTKVAGRDRSPEKPASPGRAVGSTSGLENRVGVLTIPELSGR